MSRSSMSRNDMWQPEQPSSHTVATFTLLTFASHQGDVAEELSALGHLGDRGALLAQGAGRADVDALAAPRAAGALAPRLVQIGNDARFDPAGHHVPGVRAF